MSETDYRLQTYLIPKGREVAAQHPEAVAKVNAAIEALKAKMQGGADQVNKAGVAVGLGSEQEGEAGQPVIATGTSPFYQDHTQHPVIQEFLNKHFFEPNRPPPLELDEDEFLKKMKGTEDK